MYRREYYDNQKHRNSDSSFKGPSTPVVLSVANILSCICDERTLSLFKAVAFSESDDAGILITKLSFTRKQYYSNIGKLVHAGLVKRINCRYRLSSFGKVIFSAQIKIETEIERAIKYFWKLMAVDSIMVMSVGAGKELPIEELQRIIDALIDNQEIKNILVSKGTLITR